MMKTSIAIMMSRVILGAYGLLLLISCNENPTKQSQIKRLGSPISPSPKASIPDNIYEYIINLPLLISEKNKLIEAVKMALLETKDQNKRDKLLEDVAKDVGDPSLAQKLKNKVDKAQPILGSKSPPPIVPKKPISTKVSAEKPFPGLTNLGSTCFANASIHFLLSSNWVKNVLQGGLVQQPTEPAEHFNLRKNLHKALNALSLARENRQPKLCNELKAFFDAYEKARKAIWGSPKVDNLFKIGKDQADPKPFIDDILRFLNAPEPVFRYNVFTDNTTRIYPENEVIIPIPLDPTTKNKSMADLINNWRAPEPMTAALNNQAINTVGVLMDSMSFQTLKSPPPKSLFISLGRFTYTAANPEGVRLTNRIVQSKEITFFATDEGDIKQSDKFTYTLRLIIIHQGHTGGGHYYAYSFEKAKNQWIDFDDSAVTITNETEVFKDAEQNGYIYLYEQKE